MHFNREDTISALATAHGTAAIAVVRLSGTKAIAIAESVFMNRKMEPKKISDQPGNTVHYGMIGDGSYVLDEVLLT
ncbi:MAG TPA: tRNA uridine-5-carboxymethylaminomethyl(34) synthesis GTPase MnmE, partial [Bacteroidia bacterium]|nr:tRNA uridine-5-carboxymethylaminomethyl(34) synthesis GTPase MnmE [Bacteroidia bacterium]